MYDLPQKKYSPQLVESSQNVPGRIRIGDVDADGFPDIILTQTYKNGKDINSETEILKNAHCSVNDKCLGEK